MSSRPNDIASNSTDRRDGARTDTRIQAVIEDARYDSLVFVASGFSRTGAFLQRPDDGTPLPALESVIPLVFRWPLETQMPPVRVAAKVVRRTADGIGVHFEIR